MVCVMVTARLVTLAPHTVEARVALGICLRGLGKPQDAEKEYEKALEDAPNHPAALFNLALGSLALCLSMRAHDVRRSTMLTLVMALVAVLTLLSVGFYVAEWVRHMNEAEAGH